MSRRKLDSNISQRIINQVIQMTARGSTATVSTKQIALKLGVTEPVIFSRFPTKQKLMDAAFVYAWKRFGPSPTIDFELLKKGPIDFQLLLPLIREKLKRKKEIIYLQHYGASIYYNHDLVISVEMPYYLFFDQTIAQVYGHFATDKLRLIEHVFLVNEISIFYNFVIGNYSLTDENIHFLFRAATGMLEAALGGLSAK